MNTENMFRDVFAFHMKLLCETAYKRWIETLEGIDWGLPKITVISSDDMDLFPERFRSSTVNAKLVKIKDLKKMRNCKRVLAWALSKYPYDVISRNLGHIYLFEKLSLYGVDYGGTYIDNNLLLTCYDYYALEQHFHHEYSSVLLNNHNTYFDRRKWESINPETFKYSGTGIEAIKEGKCYGEGDSFYQEGFIIEYAKSSLENDFNTIAMRLFNAKYLRINNMNILLHSSGQD